MTDYKYIVYMHVIYVYVYTISVCINIYRQNGPHNLQDLVQNENAEPVVQKLSIISR